MNGTTWQQPGSNLPSPRSDTSKHTKVPCADTVPETDQHPANEQLPEKRCSCSCHEQCSRNNNTVELLHTGQVTTHMHMRSQYSCPWTHRSPHNSITNNNTQHNRDILTPCCRCLLLPMLPPASHSVPTASPQRLHHGRLEQEEKEAVAAGRQAGRQRHRQAKGSLSEVPVSDHWPHVSTHKQQQTGWVLPCVPLIASPPFASPHQQTNKPPTQPPSLPAVEGDRLQSA